MEVRVQKESEDITISTIVYKSDMKYVCISLSFPACIFKHVSRNIPLR